MPWGSDQFQKAAFPDEGLLDSINIKTEDIREKQYLRDFRDTHELVEQRSEVSKRPLCWPVDRRSCWIIVNFHEDSI